MKNWINYIFSFISQLLFFFMKNSISYAILDHLEAWIFKIATSGQSIVGPPVESWTLVLPKTKMLSTALKYAKKRTLFNGKQIISYCITIQSDGRYLRQKKQKTKKQNKTNLQWTIGGPGCDSSCSLHRNIKEITELRSVGVPKSGHSSKWYWNITRTSGSVVLLSWNLQIRYG